MSIIKVFHLNHGRAGLGRRAPCLMRSGYDKPHLLSLHSALVLEEGPERALGGDGALEVNGSEQEAAALSLSLD